VVVRDENGDVLLLAWKPLRFFVADVEETEAEACLHGLKLVATRFRKPPFKAPSQSGGGACTRTERFGHKQFGGIAV
jgi:hypothetical protein